MDIKQINTQLSVAGQISIGDLPAIAKLGFKSIVCNRPDGESSDQLSFGEIEREAKRLGLQTRYLPAESGKVTAELGQAFGALMDELPQPMLAYCRSGLRSSTLWALARSPKEPLPQIYATVAQAGYDIESAVQRALEG